MLTKAVASAADHVFGDLKMLLRHRPKRQRETIAEALNNLDWGKKTAVFVSMILARNGAMKTSSPLRKPVKISTQSCCPSRSMQPMQFRHVAQPIEIKLGLVQNRPGSAHR